MLLDLTDKQRAELEQLEYNELSTLYQLAKREHDPILAVVWEGLTYYRRRVVYQHALSELDRVQEVNQFYRRLCDMLLERRVQDGQLITVDGKAFTSVVAYVQEIEDTLSAWERDKYAYWVRHFVKAKILPILKEAAEKPTPPLWDAISLYLKKKLAFLASSALCLLSLLVLAGVSSYVSVGPSEIFLCLALVFIVVAGFLFVTNFRSDFRKLRVACWKQRFTPKLDDLKEKTEEHRRQAERRPTELLELHVADFFQLLSWHPEVTKKVLTDEQKRCQQRLEKELPSCERKHDLVRDMLLVHKQLSDQLPEWFDVDYMRLALDYVCVPEHFEWRHDNRLAELVKTGLHKTAIRCQTEECYERARRFIEQHYSPHEFKRDLGRVCFRSSIDSFTAAQEEIQEHITTLEPDFDEREAAIREEKAAIRDAYLEFKKLLRQRWQQLRSDISHYRNQMSGRLPPEEIEEECAFQLNEYQKQNSQDLEAYKDQWGDPPDDPELDSLLAGTDEEEPRQGA